MLSEGLGSKVVVVAVITDPEPVHTVRLGQAERPMMKAYTHAVHLAEQLELQRRVPEVLLQKLKVLSRERLDLCGKVIKALPEAARRCVLQSSRCSPSL